MACVLYHHCLACSPTLFKSTCMKGKVQISQECINTKAMSFMCPPQLATLGLAMMHQSDAFSCMIFTNVDVKVSQLWASWGFKVSGAVLGTVL